MAKDMTIGSPAKVMVHFTIPIVLGNFFQQLYNIVDSIIVGNYIGADALGAVGITSSITFLFVALATGSTIGASVIISQLYGAKAYGRMKTAIYTTLVAMLGLSLVLTAAGLGLHRWILTVLKTPSELYQDAADYLMIYVAGTVFLFYYNAFNAVFNALGDSKIPLIFLLCSSVLNVVLDLYMVITLDMGVAGAAWATVISQAVSAVLSAVVLLRRIHAMQITEPHRIFDRSCFGTICRVAIPSTIQQSIVSVGILMIQSVINSFGPAVIAGCAAAMKVDNVTVMPFINISNAMGNYAAQNLGAGKAERVRPGLRVALIMDLVVWGVILLLFQCFPEVFVSAFVNAEQTDPQVIAVGATYLRLVSVINLIFAIMILLNGLLKGAGDMRVFLFITLLNLGIRVLFSFILAAFIGWTAVCWALLIGWGCGLIVAVWRYRSGAWEHQKLI